MHPRKSLPMTPTLYLEDLSPGQRFASASLTLDPDAIREFAARFDPQPFHLDDEAARPTLFGGLAASRAGANGATGPEALPKLTIRPKGARQSSDLSQVSLPTES